MIAMFMANAAHAIFVAGAIRELFVFWAMLASAPFDKIRWIMVGGIVRVLS